VIQPWQRIVLAVAVVGLLASSCGGGSSTSDAQGSRGADKSRAVTRDGTAAGTAPVETKPPPPQEPVTEEQKGLERDPYPVSFFLYIDDDKGTVSDTDLTNVSLTPIDHSACTKDLFSGNASPASDQLGNRTWSISPAFTALPWPCVVLSTARWDLRFKYKGVSKIVKIDFNQQLGEGCCTVECVDLLPIPVDCNDHSDERFNNDHARIFAHRAANDG
jgi:hypothetical protein